MPSTRHHKSVHIKRKYINLYSLLRANHIITQETEMHRFPRSRTLLTTLTNRLISIVGAVGHPVAAEVVGDARSFPAREDPRPRRVAGEEHGLFFSCSSGLVAPRLSFFGVRGWGEVVAAWGLFVSSGSDSWNDVEFRIS